MEEKREDRIQKKIEDTKAKLFELKELLETEEELTSFQKKGILVKIERLQNKLQKNLLKQEKKEQKEIEEIEKFEELEDKYEEISLVYEEELAYNDSLLDEINELEDRLNIKNRSKLDAYDKNLNKLSPKGYQARGRNSHVKTEEEIEIENILQEKYEALDSSDTNLRNLEKQIEQLMKEYRRDQNVEKAKSAVTAVANVPKGFFGKLLSMARNAINKVKEWTNERKEIKEVKKAKKEEIEQRKVNRAIRSVESLEQSEINEPIQEEKEEKIEIAGVDFEAEVVSPGYTWEVPDSVKETAEMNAKKRKEANSTDKDDEVVISEEEVR